MQDKNFCTLKSFNSLEELLTTELSFSKGLIKKYLSKKKLQSLVRERDQIFIPIEILNSGITNPTYSGPSIPVLMENEDFIAFNKPEGIHGHPLSYKENNTLLNYIRSKYSCELFLERSLEAELGLLYRLDSLTSGVLIFAKNFEVFKEVRSTFSLSAKKKSYLAIVSGEFNENGTHAHYLESFGQKGAKMRVSETGVKKVEINVLLVSYNAEANVSLVQVELGQGARHQIRCQLSEIGFPILGDTLYGGIESERLFLHSYKYEISSGEINLNVTAKDAYLFNNFFDLNSCL